MIETRGILTKRCKISEIGYTLSWVMHTQGTGFHELKEAEMDQLRFAHVCEAYTMNKTVSIF